MMMSLSTDHQDGRVVTVARSLSVSGKPGSDCCNVATLLQYSSLHITGGGKCCSTATRALTRLSPVPAAARTNVV